MRILNFGGDYAHERKLQEEKKQNVENSVDTTSVIPEELAKEMGLLPDNTSEEKKEEAQAQEEKETKRGRKNKKV